MSEPDARPIPRPAAGDEVPARGTPAAEGLRPWIDFVALSVIWGASYLFLKLGLDDGTPPLTIVAWRIGIAVAALTVAVRLTGGRLPTGRVAVVTFVVLALLNVSLPWVLVSWGAQYIPSGLAAIINALNPLFTIVIASLVLHDEPMTVNRVAGLLLGFVGAVTLASPNLGADAGSPETVLVIAAELALVVASLSYAAGVVWARHRVTGRAIMADPRTGPRAPRPMEIAYGQLLIALLINAPLALVFERPPDALVPLPGSPVSWLSVLWLGLLSTATGFVLSFRVIRTWGATRQSLVTYIIPIVAIALGVIVLDEQLHPAEVVGTLLIIAGVVLATSRFGQRRIFGRRLA